MNERTKEAFEEWCNKTRKVSGIMEDKELLKIEWVAFKAGWDAKKKQVLANFNRPMQNSCNVAT